MQKLGITIIWSRPGDGDIVVTTPNNNNIYWDNKGPSASTDGGFLDLDDEVGTGPESIYWPNDGPDPPNGDYSVCFQSYNFTLPISAQNPVSARATVRLPSGATLQGTKTFTSPTPLTNQCTSSSAGFIGTFTYPF